MTIAEPPGVRDGFVQANGVRLHYADYGGAGEPLLLLHGTGLCARIWDELAPAFRTRYRVMALDRRGHGDSEKPDSGYQLEDFAEDVAAFCAALELHRLDAVGHSSGAALLGVVAARRPRLVRRAVLVDPILFGARRSGMAGHISGIAERIGRRRAQWPDRRAMFDALRSRPPHSTWSEPTLWAFVNHGARALPDGTVELKCPPTIEAQMYQHDPTLDLIAAFISADASFRAIRAAQSDRFNPAAAERLCAKARDFRLQTMPGVSHFAPMERPREIARLALELLLGETFGS
ncbi:MAG TPA: alpha/beta hydrolase [Dehalococcoidia bacterium]|nr:alpha/beta hydrolase [Dehalococcoidia bacterium]